jgi:hypothetical protein
MSPGRWWNFLPFLMAVIFLGPSSWASSGITFQGRLLDAAGIPVTASNVQFKLQIRTPGPEDCLLYEEIQTQDLSLTSGVFAVSVGDGTGTRTDGHAADWTLFQSLSNRGSFNFSVSDCSGATTYAPNASDNRRFKVFFDLGTGWESLPTQTINYIPMSIESYAVGGFPASSLLRVEDAGALVNTTPLSNAQYTELLALLGGSSGQYEHAGELGGSALPSLGAGQTMVSDGSGGWSAALPLTSESDPLVSAFAKTALPNCATGEVLKADGTSLSCVLDAGGWSAVDATDTVKGVVMVPVSGGLEVSSGSLGLPTQAGVTPGSATKVTVDAHGIVTATGSITGADLTSGEIGGSTSVNTSGNLVTTGSVTSTGDVSVTGVGGKVSATNGEFRRLHLLDDQATPHYVEVRSPDPLTANYTLTLPGSLGSANQLLGMNNAGNALENKTLTAGTGVTITHSAGGIEIAASGSGGTVTSVTGTAPIIVDNSNPNTPIVSLNDSGVGIGTYGSATEVPVITVDAKGRITSASNTTISGVSPTGSNLATGKAWIGDGTGKAAEAYINVSDLKKSDGTPQIPSTCTASQTMTWSSVTDVFTCSNITVTKSQISDFPTLGTAALEDVGTNAGDVVQLDPSGKLPAVDGSQLTNLTLPSYDTTYFKQGGNDFSATATLGTTGNNDLNIITNNTTKMTVLANGNVGIGTGSPAARLDLGSSDENKLKIGNIVLEKDTMNTAPTDYGFNLYSASAEDMMYLKNETSGNRQILMFGDGGATNNIFGISTSADAGATYNARFVVNQNGNVGIGTTNPHAKLMVAADTDVAINIGNATTTASGSTADPLSRTLEFTGYNNHQLAFIRADDMLSSVSHSNLIFGVKQNGTDATEFMRIDGKTGNVGIGTTNPAVSLDLGTKTDAVRLPAGTTAQQPATPSNGMIRYNSQSNKFEAYENGAWTNMIGGTASSASSVAAGAGSAATPSISFSGDTDTGFYSSGTNSIGISAGGNKVWDITTSAIVSPTAGGASIASAAGTAAAPTFSFAGDTDTGWYLAASNTLAASTGGVERIRIGPSGSVGIGTTSPAAKLHVESEGQFGQISVFSHSDTPKHYAGVIGYRTRGTIAAPTQIQLGDTMAVFHGRNGINDAWGGMNIIATENHSSTAAGNEITFNTTANGSLTPSQRMTIGQDGNVGIGTADPKNKLHVMGSVRVETPTDANVYMGLSNEASNRSWQMYQLASTNASAPNGFLLEHYDGTSYKPYLTVSETGNVGIGTTNPTEDLSIEGDGPAGIRIVGHGATSSHRGMITLVGLGGSLASPTATPSGHNLGTLQFNGYDGSAYTTRRADITASATESYTPAAQGSNLTFSTTANGTTLMQERMRIDQSGNIGIGTSTPSARLQVYGGAILGQSVASPTAADHVVIQSDGDVPYEGGLLFINHSSLTTGSGIKISEAYSSSGNPQLTIGAVSIASPNTITTQYLHLAGGKVGIGTTTPAATLHVSNGAATTNAVASLETTGTSGRPFLNFKAEGLDYGWVGFGSTGNNNMGLVNYQNAPLDFGTNSIVKMTILANGNVGIGTKTPAHKLEVVGDIAASGCLSSSAGVASGTCVSDERLKTDIHDFNLGLDALLGIQPHLFKYNGLGEHPKSTRPELGVIAQEVEMAAPQLVSTRKVKLHPQDQQLTEIKQVNYTAFIYVLINSVKDLYHQWMDDSQDLHREISSLKSENKAMKEYLCAKDPQAPFCPQK